MSDRNIIKGDDFKDGLMKVLPTESTAAFIAISVMFPYLQGDTLINFDSLVIFGFIFVVVSANIWVLKSKYNISDNKFILISTLTLLIWIINIDADRIVDLIQYITLEYATPMLAKITHYRIITGVTILWVIYFVPTLSDMVKRANLDSGH